MYLEIVYFVEVTENLIILGLPAFAESWTRFRHSRLVRIYGQQFRTLVLLWNAFNILCSISN